MLRDSYHEIEMQYTCLEEVPRNILKYGQIRAVLSYPMVSSLWVMGYRFDPSSTFESNKTETIGTEKAFPALSLATRRPQHQKKLSMCVASIFP